MSAKTSFLISFVAAASMSAAVAGDLERYCPAGGGGPITERWSAVPPGGIPWTLHTPSVHGVGPTVMPEGYPRTNDASCNWTALDEPGVRSIVRAARAWNDITLFAPPGTVVTGKLLADPTVGQAQTTTFFCQASGVFHATAVASPLATPPGNENVFTCHETWCFWGNVAPGSFAVTLIARDGPTGNILDADVAINATEVSGTPPLYGWAEYREDLGQPGVGEILVSGRFWQNPLGVWLVVPGAQLVDLEGVAAHGFGHVLGLGHSMLDARTNRGVLPGADTSEFPTMFERAQADLVAEVYPTTSRSSYLLYPDQGTGTDTCATGPSSTGNVAGQIVLGASARQLEFDDVAAIGRGYPSGAIGFSAISGTVTVDQTGAGAVGAHVVAVSRQDPETVRASTFVYGGSGSYVIDHLPAGEYSVYVEPIDETRYFAGTLLPEFIAGSPVDCTPPVQFPIEFWNAGDAGGSELGGQMDYVTTTAGLPTTGIDIVVSQNVPDLLSVRPGTGAYSPRGVVLQPGASGNVQVQVDLTSFPPSGAELLIQFSTARINERRHGNSVQVVQEAGVVTQGMIVVGQDLLGFGPAGTVVTRTATLTSAQATENVFVQAYLVDAAVPDRIVSTNSANIWWSQP